jgi:adenosylhomocysteine nucleosidase
MTTADGGPAAARTAPAPAPADVGIVAALPMEVAALIGRFANVRKYQGPRHRIIEGEIGGKIVALIVAGPGRPAARRATELLLVGHRPRWIVSAGFGGALDPALKRNAIVLPGEVIDEDGGQFSIDVAVPEGSEGFGTGRLVTVDRVVLTAAEKAALRAGTGADVVDMETSAVAAVCHARGVRMLALRVISDAAGVDLPPEILSIMGPTGSYRVGAAVGAIWKRPGSLKELWRLREQALGTARRLAEVLPAALARLPD